mgnify:CR=1 FL=1
MQSQLQGKWCCGCGSVIYVHYLKLHVMFMRTNENHDLVHLQKLVWFHQWIHQWMHQQFHQLYLHQCCCLLAVH